MKVGICNLLVCSHPQSCMDIDKWTALWSKHQSDAAMKDLNCLQKVNHFPGSWCVGRKDRLMGTINAMKRIHGHHFDFHPDGYILPNDRDALSRLLSYDISAAPKSHSHLSYWILKPCASSCGRGIRVLTSQQVLKFITAKTTRNKNGLVQRYLHNPYLIQGKKFDLRIYCLVTGVDPLRIYVHQEGLTRFSTVAYSLRNTKNRFALLLFPYACTL